MTRRKAEKVIDLMVALKQSLDATKMWRCMQCSEAHRSSDMLSMHSANTDHQPFFGTKADLVHHRGVLAKHVAPLTPSGGPQK